MAGSPLRRVGATIAAAVTCLSLTACGNDAPAGEHDESVASTTLTAPETALELGEPATVPIGDDGVARLTVTRIESGDPADLKAFGKDAEATVSYVWIKVAPVSGDMAGFASYKYVHGWSGDDLVPHVLTDPKPYPACPTRYFPNNAPAGVLETCTVFTSATPIDRVGFHDDGDYRGNGDEIVWR